MPNYVKAERVSIKTHPELDEKWVQDRIAEDPAILGLGDVIVRDRERIQPGAGRLDLLLQTADVDALKRYEVEIQLGKTDESHIIRTIEYWDIERKRYPQYEHCAVIVAEEITGRFLNVIGLFAGSIPLMALQVSAIKVGENITLTFAKVVDEIKRGPEDDGPEIAEPTDRTYWENRSSKALLQVTDELVGMLKTFDSTIEARYNKHYIGLARNGKANNFVYFIPKQAHVRVCISLPQSEELDKELDNAELDIMEYNSREGRYRIRVNKESLAQHCDLIRKVLQLAYKNAVE